MPAAPQPSKWIGCWRLILSLSCGWRSDHSLFIFLTRCTNKPLVFLSRREDFWEFVNHPFFVRFSQLAPTKTRYWHASSLCAFFGSLASQHHKCPFFRIRRHNAHPHGSNTTNTGIHHHHREVHSTTTPSSFSFSLFFDTRPTIKTLKKLSIFTLFSSTTCFLTKMFLTNRSCVCVVAVRLCCGCCSCLAVLSVSWPVDRYTPA